ncbi:MAG: hypothetical protein IJH20_02420 [Bacilli bacterium]|nr:hypothetical protein [Bacilli bacterium]
MELSVSGLKKDATKIENFNKNLDNDYLKILSALSTLEKIWTGPRAESFYDAIKSIYLKELKEVIKSLDDYRNYVNSVPNVYQTLDRSYTNKKIDV